MTLLSATHPLLGLTVQVATMLDEVALTEPAFLSVEDKAAVLRDLAALEARLVGLRLRVMAAAGDVAEAAAARDVAAWWAHQTRTETSTARTEDRLARALDRRWRRVGTALTIGQVSLTQAKVIVAALEQLPDLLDPAIVDAAEEALVDHAATFRPSDLRRLGRRILEVVAPDLAEAAEARHLQRLEHDAEGVTRLHLQPLGDGTTRLTALLPAAAAARLRTYLEAFTSPRRPHAGGDLPAGEAARSEAASVTAPFVVPAAGAPEVARMPYSRRLGHAFCALLEHLDPDRLPAHGGDATTVIVTIGLDQLRTELATADLLDLDHDATTSPAMAPPSPPPGAPSGPPPSPPPDDPLRVGNLTAAQARRLACTARIIPAVLGTSSELLDLGRATRLFSPAQRKALRLRDRRCRAEGCTIPATWCEAHHLTPWAAGGPTTLENGILLCSFHHQRAHDPHYQSHRRPGGDIRYIRGA